MSDAEVVDDWKFHKFGMLVTGRGEGAFLPSFLRSLASAGNCTFNVIGNGSSALSDNIAEEKAEDDRQWQADS